MAKVTLTANLQKYFPSRELEVPGPTLRAVLDALETMRPQFLGYILEDNGAIRKHVNIFIDGQLLRDKANLTIALTSTSQVHIMQALSGG